MWPSESDLESIDSIIDRMNPMSGFPYPMKSAKNEGFPRSCGDPWIGAYTKNGYWFQLSWNNGQQEWKEAANEMWYRNQMLVDEKSFEIYRNSICDEKNKGELKLLCAKNIRGDILGLALLSKHQNSNYSVLGPMFVQEDFRHVGIGSTLLEEIMRTEKEIAFNAISYLLPTIEQFNLAPKLMRSFGRIRVKNPSGFSSLKEDKPGIRLLFGCKISSRNDWERVTEFGEQCTNERRNWRAFVEEDSEKDEKNQLVAAFEETTESCVGISVLREIHNEDGEIPDLLVAPLYARNQSIAEILLQKSLLKHYNPEDDYDFDIDHHAIYRRSVNFFTFSNCESMMFPLLRKLTGNDGKMEKDRLTYQTCSNFQLPAICHDWVFAMGDPNIELV